MNIDIYGAVIFTAAALLVFKHDFKQSTTVIFAVIAGILTPVLVKLLAYTPFAISGASNAINIAITPTQIILVIIQVFVIAVALLMIRKDTESFVNFIIWIAAGIFVNYMLLPTFIH